MHAEDLWIQDVVAKYTKMQYTTLSNSKTYITHDVMPPTQIIGHDTK